MGGMKRKEAPAPAGKFGKKPKIQDDSSPKTKKLDKQSILKSQEDEESDGSPAFDGEGIDADEREYNEEGLSPQASKTSVNGASNASDGAKKFKLDTSSSEAHAKQRQLAKERKAAKPNADSIHRSKQIWERLRRKSHVPKDERDKLVAELFTIINGRVRDFVFKHDSVRVIQCALKYSNKEKRLGIVRELKADLRPLAESRYGKFLVAKMVVEGDDEIKNLIVPEFYGHVKRLINHPEASWIVDDIYRQIATPAQKAIMLREWYGTEFALENRERKVGTEAGVTADLVEILEQHPEKRKPILQQLLAMINSLIQKKMTGFTMLHDAMLQYFQAIQPGSEEHTEFLEILKGDIDKETEGGGGDLYKNLAFTKSGSRLVCLALAYGSAKDRKVVLKVFRDTIEMMALDSNAKMVLLAGLETPDDTKMSGQTIYRELLGEKLEDDTQRLDRLAGLVTHLNARLPILYPMAGAAKWLMSDTEKALLAEVHEIRKTTSKKDSEVRRQDLLKYLSSSVLELVTTRADILASSSFGCQFITESLLSVPGDKTAAKEAVAVLAAGDPLEEGHLARNAATSRMLKTLVQGGTFDPASKTTKLAEHKLGFGEAVLPVIKEQIVHWACSDSSFVVVAMLESEDVPDEAKSQVKKALGKGKKEIEKAAKGEGKSKHKPVDAQKGSKKSKAEAKSGNAGARILLERL